MIESKPMVTLTTEKQHEFLKGVLEQWWHVGPLQIALEIKNKPKFNHFGDDVEECWIAYCSYREPKRTYESEDTGYRNLIIVCDAHAVPYVIADNTVGQMHFYIPSKHKMTFLEGLEAHVAVHG
jgi:hypothetical protein